MLFVLDEYQVQDYEVAPRNEQRDFDDFDSTDIFRTVPKPAITFGFWQVNYNILMQKLFFVVNCVINLSKRKVYVFVDIDMCLK